MRDAAAPRELCETRCTSSSSLHAETPRHPNQERRTLTLSYIIHKTITDLRCESLSFVVATHSMPSFATIQEYDKVQVELE